MDVRTLKEHEDEVAVKVAQLVEVGGFLPLEAVGILAEAREARIAEMLQAQYAMVLAKHEESNDEY